MQQLGLHWAHEILYLTIFRKSVKEIQVSLKSDKNNGYFTQIPMYIHDNILVYSS
jgi:hypothetical protein